MNSTAKKTKAIEALFQGFPHRNEPEESKRPKNSEYSSSEQFEGGSEEAEGEELFSSFGERTESEGGDKKEEAKQPPSNSGANNKAGSRFVEIEKRMDTKFLTQADTLYKSEGTDNWDNVVVEKPSKTIKKVTIQMGDKDHPSGGNEDERSIETDPELYSEKEKVPVIKTYGRNASLLSNKNTVGRVSTLNEKSKSTLSNKKKSREVKELGTHEKFVILFATLLLRAERINDSFYVCNIYGRRLLHDNELARANIYKILALT